MARKESPVLHNFFQTSTSANNKKREERTDNPVKVSSLTEKVGHIVDVSILDESWVATNSRCREFSPTSLGMDTDAVDGLRLHKKARVEISDENRKLLEGTTTDDLSLTMQPPRLLCSNLQHPATNLDGPKVISKQRDCNMPFFSGMFGPSRTSQKGLYPDSIPMNGLRESTSATFLNVAPADEGSRTGLKGSNGGGLMNCAVGGGPVLSLGQSKSSSRGIGSQSTYLASHETMPITRQLTIFYGGQAHVFEDVSVEKAEAIMALAGSTGRSWSTVYSPQRKASIPSSVTEGSLSTHDRDRLKGGSKPTSANVVENSSGFSSEVRNALSSLFHKGHRQVEESRVQEYSSQFAKWATDMQTIADYVGKKPEATPQVSARAVDLDKESSALHR